MIYVIILIWGVGAVFFNWLDLITDNFTLYTFLLNSFWLITYPVIYVILYFKKNGKNTRINCTKKR